MHRDECSRVISAAAPHARPLPAGESSARRETAWRTTSRLEKAFSRREVVPEVLDGRADESPAGRGRGWGAAAEITRLQPPVCTLEAAGARDAERDHEMPCSHHQTLPRSCRHFSEPFPYLLNPKSFSTCTMRLSKTTISLPKTTIEGFSLRSIYLFFPNASLFLASPTRGPSAPSNPDMSIFLSSSFLFYLFTKVI